MGSSPVSTRRCKHALQLAGLALAFVGISLVSGPAAAAGNDDCLMCHSEASLTTERAGKTVSLHVDSVRFGRSPHKDMACTDCHQGLDASAVPHAKKIAPVDCASCHGDAAEKHPFHAAMSEGASQNDSPATSCKGCHGTHDILPLSDPASPMKPVSIPAFCARCHARVATNWHESEHGHAVAAGIKGAPSCLTCHSHKLTRGWYERADAATLKVAQERMCLTCHRDDPEVRARTTPTAGFIAAYETSVHGSALSKGNGKAATCVDCHGSHEMKKGYDPSSRVAKIHIPDLCGKCHGPVAAAFARSIHATAVRHGNTDAPVCTDCHGEHTIFKHNDPRSPVAFANLSSQVCTPCHSSVALSRKYGLAPDRGQTFADSYHGLALRGGSVAAANCASCHGSHEILRSSDPASMVNKANLEKTCGKCHPGANARFGVGSVHVAVTQEQSPILWWIGRAYVVLIILTIGGMFFHNLFDFLRKSRRIQRERRGGGAEAEAPRRGGSADEGAPALYLRMTGLERLQHACLLLSFFLLVLTGFMLRYPDAWWVRGIRSLSTHVFVWRSLIHRIAGVVMVVASVFHLGYVAFSLRGRRFVRDVFPVPSDLVAVFHLTGWNLGLRRQRPLFGRFSYIEKAEYWALVWGTIVMAATGAIMWFENISMGLVTKLGWDIARTVHFYEAWLAFLAIVVWHLYFVIVNPDAYPMNLAWIRGTISEREMEEEHPLELEAIRRERLLREEEAGAGPKDASGPS